jgi:hypothetical protein
MTKTTYGPEIEAKCAKFAALVRVRRGQTGQRAAATTRRIEALYRELYEVGAIDANGGQS